MGISPHSHVKYHKVVNEYEENIQLNKECSFAVIFII